MDSEFKLSFKAGESLFEEGDEGDCAFIIEKGEIEVFFTKNNQKLMICTLKEGDLLGEMALLDELPRTASAIAMENTEVIIIPREYITQKIEYSDPTVRFFLKVILERYRDLRTRMNHVFEGLTPDQSYNQEMYASTSSVVKNLMFQYLDMQERILSAVSTSDAKDDPNKSYEDVTITRKVINANHSLEKALEKKEFRLLYQPIIDLSNGEISGCEALVRWQHPTKGLIGPLEFIPQAESSGLITPLGYWIAEEACGFQKRISQTNKPDFFTNINLSGKQFEDKNLIEKLDQIVQNFAGLPELIKFEITESLLMANPEMANDALNRLKETGVKLAIDDFGTGYSSLSYLHRFPFDTLKIDRSFVNTMMQNKKSNEIVKSLIDLSHNLGMNVVAEGIETKYEETMIKNYRSEYGQGFLYAKPLTEDEIIQSLNK